MVEALIAISILCLILAIRNLLVYRIRIDALERVGVLARDAIDNHEDWEMFYQKFNERSYERLLFDLTVWTKRQAYPWLYKSESRY